MRYAEFARRQNPKDAGPLPTLEAHPMVTDITIDLDTGERVTLDGLFGTNLLLPTVAGLGGGLPTDMAPGPYRRIWIDGPRGRLRLELP